MRIPYLRELGVVMNWVERYSQPVHNLWQGRNDLPDSSCFFQLMQFLDLTKKLTPSTKPAFALLGFQCDEGIRRNFGREGAKEGPDAIRTVLANIPVNDPELICFDAGNISCFDRNLEQSQAALAEAVALLLQHNFIPIVLGGGHELAWGDYQAIERQFPNKSLGIVNFDAHFDMRPVATNGTSGTPFLQIALAHEQAHKKLDYNCIGIQPAGNIASLFATAQKYHVNYILAEDIYLRSTAIITPFVERVINDNEIIYLSLCLDVFAAHASPGVSAPQTLGITPWQVLPALRQLAASGKVVVYDIAEMSPRYDIDDRTAKLAALFIYEIVHHHKGITYEK